MRSLGRGSLVIWLMISLVKCDVFVEDIGETETISIDDLSEAEDSDVHKFLETAPEAENVQDLSRQKRQVDFDPNDADDDAGSGDETSYDDDEDYDQMYEEDYDEETGIQSPASVDETTPIMPTRVIPNLQSPYFEAENSSHSMHEVIAPSAPTNEPPQIYSSFSFPEVAEGSGNEDYNEIASIAPSRPIGVFPDRSGIPEFSSVFPSYFDPNHELGVVTEKIPNQPPYVQNKIPKYAVTAGQTFSVRISDDIFHDLEDGNTRNLSLKLKHENGTVVRNSWIGFDEENQVVYALPVDESDIGNYRFRLEAYDREGLATSDTFDLSVRQYSGSRLMSHHFSIEFSFADNSLSAIHNWPWKFIEKVAEFFGDSKLRNIIVREVKNYPFVFGWTNDTLTQTSCPKETIRSLYSMLVDENVKVSKSMTGSPSRKLKALFGNQIIIKSVSLKYHGMCLRDASLNPTVIGKDAAVPVIRNPIDKISVFAGELLRYKVPEDTCWDAEDGPTPNLNLQLLTTNRKELSPSAWLQFDPKNQEFVGIPLEEEVGREEYQLVCSDRNGLSAIDGIIVIVQTRPFTEGFGVEFALEFRDFSNHRRDTKVKIVETIAKYFGDKSTSNVILKTFDADEAKVVWYNKTLSKVSCDDPNMKWVANQMLLPDGKIRPRFAQHFEPSFQLIDVDAVKRGACMTLPPDPTSGGPRNEDGGLSGTDTIFHGIIPSADYLLTFIIPAIIITCMLIMAILLACLLHKKRKAGKLNLFYSESLPPRVPVILQDELFEDQDHGYHKQPVLLPEDAHTPRGGGHFNPHEMDRLLQQPDFNRAGSLSRPTPAYQRRHV